MKLVYLLNKGKNCCYILITIFSFILLSMQPIKGSFIGQVLVEWLNENGPDRNMKLIRKFEYKDSAGKVWMVPAGTIINGASIPPLFWQLVGPPFVGDYRKASVVHDYYCDKKNESWLSVHRMFFEACLAGGVSEIQAKIMYTAVYAEGPRWELVRVKNLEGKNNRIEIIERKAEVSADSIQTVKKWIETFNPNLNSIELKLDSLVSERIINR
jgi:hypothetical protein